VYLDLVASDPPSPTPPEPVPPPDLSGGPPHLSYTFQWLIFSLCAAAGWVFAVRRSVRTRRAKAGALDEPEAVEPTESFTAQR
jgi:cytochrome oxidase assembly protein ShyY1